MFYDRQVRYLDYLVNGERLGNAGFIKMEVRGEVCNINISVKGLDVQQSSSLQVYIVSGGKEYELCKLEPVQGKAIKQLLGLNARNIAGTGLAYSDLEAIRIPVLAGREICGILKHGGGQEGGYAELKAVAESDVLQSPESEEVLYKELQEELPEEKLREEELQEEELCEEEPHNNESSKRMPQMTLQDTKWKQLWEIYPHINPFRDEREFLSIGPGDFVILPEKYFGMANNSFLLHGYYNYKHLILKRMEYKGEVRYYIGVPGTFYDREKQVAVMFGFESFESLRDPADAGEYGYYMMRVEL